MKYCANITWLTADEGGRQNPVPEGARYAPIIKSPALDDYEGSWSIIADRTASERFEFSFLSADAPQTLREGDAFTLHEGSRITARGVINSVSEDSQ